MVIISAKDYALRTGLLFSRIEWIFLSQTWIRLSSSFVILHANQTNLHASAQSTCEGVAVGVFAEPIESNRHFCTLIECENEAISILTWFLNRWFCASLCSSSHLAILILAVFYSPHHIGEYSSVMHCHTRHTYSNHGHIYAPTHICMNTHTIIFQESGAWEKRVKRRKKNWSDIIYFVMVTFSLQYCMNWMCVQRSASFPPNIQPSYWL